MRAERAEGRDSEDRVRAAAHPSQSYAMATGVSRGLSYPRVLPSPGTAMRTVIRSVLVLLGLALVGTSARAQAVQGLQVGVSTQVALESSAHLAPAPQPAIARKRGMPQMIIGGAALVGGAIIGDDVGTIVMLAGLAYGIYGLYLFLQ